MDNNTLYRSPVRLVSSAGEPLNPYLPQIINRAKKKLLAEVALHDNELQINDISYTKNDVISLLDSVTDETVWRYHCAVYALPALLRFLEEGWFDNKNIGSEIIEIKEESFSKFISFPFAIAFNQATSGIIRNQLTQKLTNTESNVEHKEVVIVGDGKTDRFAMLSSLMTYQQFILPQHQHIAFERIRIYFHELLYTLRNLSWEKFREDESVLHFAFSESWISFANKLPSSFADTRDEVVEQVLNIALRFQHKATWYYLQQLCFVLQAIECSQSNKSEITRLTNHFGNNANIVSGKYKNAPRGASSYSGRAIVAVIWIVLMIVRMAGGCNSDHSYPTINEMPRSYYKMPKLDSLTTDTIIRRY